MNEHHETHAYIRVSTKQQGYESQQEAIKAYADNKGLSVDKVWTETITGTSKGIDRPELKQCLNRLRRGDTLIVWWIDRLGRDYSDTASTIRALLDQGVNIRTVNQDLTFTSSTNTQQKMLNDLMITLLTGMAEADRVNRLASAQAGRDALSKQQWQEKFKGRQADTALHERIRELRTDGVSIRGIAKELGCNPSTVQRVLKA
ncbi:recombinase family protein [Shewanella maritima]|nr:recombinase family protein [Shewanella maritima]